MLSDMAVGYGEMSNERFKYYLFVNKLRCQI